MISAACGVHIGHTPYAHSMSAGTESTYSATIACRPFPVTSVGFWPLSQNWPNITYAALAWSPYVCRTAVMPGTPAPAPAKHQLLALLVPSARTLSLSHPFRRSYHLQCCGWLPDRPRASLNDAHCTETRSLRYTALDYKTCDKHCLQPAFCCLSQMLPDICVCCWRISWSRTSYRYH